MRLGLVAFVVGLVFSLGLGLSGMTDPGKVLGFLDVLGSWDPSLIFVMLAAIPVYFVFWQIMKKRGRPLFDPISHVPTRNDIDKKLVIGASLFGVGWGVSGICPGPAIAGMGAMSVGALVFVAGVLIGTGIERALDHKLWAER